MYYEEYHLTAVILSFTEIFGIFQLIVYVLQLRRVNIHQVAKEPDSK